MTMNGAESLVRTLHAGGVDVCFANPGTSEIHIVAALDRVPAVRCVLGLFEGVVTGAADGYARMAGKPACTLLHLGPGLANGIANLHNAFRARSPILNIIGQHPRPHLRYDAPLTSDIEALARPYSYWLRTSSGASELAVDAAEALAAAKTAPGHIATLVVPADAAWSETEHSARQVKAPCPPRPAKESLRRAEAMLRSGQRTAILLDGPALYGEGLLVAGRIAASTNSKLFAPYPITRLQRGAGLPIVERIHYILEQARDQFKEFHQLILIGSGLPVAYFAYPGKNSEFISPECAIHTLARPGEDVVAALHELASALCPSDASFGAANVSRPAQPSGGITLSGVSAVVGAVLPENAIVVDESMTSGRGLMAATAGCPVHDWLGNTGGSIGIALPLAVGTAVACPDRPVLCFTADGSGMYTLQGLWTMAREGLKVTTVVFANRAYGVLKREFASLGIGDPAQSGANLFDIGRPDLDWVSLGKGMGVPSRSVQSLEEFGRCLKEGFESGGPSLIQVNV